MTASGFPVGTLRLGVTFKAQVTPEFAAILTPEALASSPRCTANSTADASNSWRSATNVRQRSTLGSCSDFLPETREIREGEWTVAPIPADLQDRRVEITGPVDRKMVINALNSGAKRVHGRLRGRQLADLGQLRRGAAQPARRRPPHDQLRQPRGQAVRLNEKMATLLVRPRGWHLPEKHVLVDGQPISGSLFDFGLYFFHNAQELMARGSGPYFYLPKMESHLEARLWNDVFVRAQELSGSRTGRFARRC